MKNSENLDANELIEVPLNIITVSPLRKVKKMKKKYFHAKSPRTQSIYFQ